MIDMSDRLSALRQWIRRGQADEQMTQQLQASSISIATHPLLFSAIHSLP